MDLQTKIPLSKESESLIDYKSKVLLLGSCFVENVGDKLEYFKFQNTINPFGILFNPKAVENLIDNALNGKFYSEDDVFFNNEKWHCFDVHSSLSNISKNELLNGLNLILEQTSQKIKEASHIVITLGTAWVYRFLKTDKFVANCHKVPQKQFNKELLSIEEVTKSLKKMLSLIRSVNYNAQIIFTVSPVRHIKDGFVENTQSKSHLISAIHQVVKNQSSYFPSFEIMMDELRDYRFYAEDMIHPNQTAVNYIWEKFKEVWVASKAYKTMADVEVIQKGLLHRPFNPNSEAHKKFLHSLETKQKDLKAQFQHISF